MERRFVIAVCLAALVLPGLSGNSYARGIRKIWVATESNAKRPVYVLKQKDSLYITVDLKNPKNQELTIKVFTPTGILWKSSNLHVKDGSTWACQMFRPPRYGFDKGRWRVEAWEGRFKRASCSFNVR